MAALCEQIGIVWVNRQPARASQHRLLLPPDRCLRLRELQKQLDVLRVCRKRLLGGGHNRFVVRLRLEASAQWRGHFQARRSLTMKSGGEYGYENCLMNAFHTRHKLYLNPAASLRGNYDILI